MNAIEIRNLSKSFRGLYAVDHLNMTVPVGAIYGFIGENGSEKSTTEKLICGLQVPDRGSIRLFGRDYRDGDVRAKVGVLIGLAGGAIMLIAFFAGAMVGGAISGLPFDTGTAGAGGIIMCMISKIFLAAVFVSIYVLTSVVGKQKLWLSMVISLCTGMLLFTMVPMITPLDSGIMNVIMCLAGGILFSLGIGLGSNAVLNKTSLV